MQEQLTKLLLEVKQVLDAHKVEFWLNDGTLLGAIRDGGFIPWGHDIDLGSWQDATTNDTKERVARDLRAKGYSVLLLPIYMTIRDKAIWADVEFYEDKEGMAVLPQLIPVNKFGQYLGYTRSIMMSPGFYTEEKQESVFRHYFLRFANAICGAIPVKCRSVIVSIIEALYRRVGYKIWSIPSGYFKSFDVIGFCGEQFKVPASPIAYLEFRYGQDWQTPNRKWRTIDDGGIKWQKSV